MLKAGIVGLPNVGKSSLFNALTKSNVLAANYPFATIEPNVGVVFVKDERLDFLSKIYDTKKTVPTSYKFIDIAGLVKGAAKGEGLGNKFLSEIREVDAIVEVIRIFDDPNITHVAGVANPLDDFYTIKLELMLADLEVIEKRLPKLQRDVKGNVKEKKIELELLQRIESSIKNEESINLKDFTEYEQKILRGYRFLSLKPIIYLLNVSEDQFLNIENDKTYQELTKKITDEGNDFVKICIKLELELIGLSDEERDEFLKAYGIDDTALNMLIKKTYKLLDLETFFTAGKAECRAWTFEKGSSAPECAGIIHSDFKRGFIAADVMKYKDLYELGSPEKVKEAGKLKIEGKNYIVKDGDVILFKFNV